MLHRELQIETSGTTCHFAGRVYRTRCGVCQINARTTAGAADCRGHAHILPPCTLCPAPGSAPMLGGTSHPSHQLCPQGLNFVPGRFTLCVVWSSYFWCFYFSARTASNLMLSLHIPDQHAARQAVLASVHTTQAKHRDHSNKLTVVWQALLQNSLQSVMLIK